MIDEQRFFKDSNHDAKFWEVLQTKMFKVKWKDTSILSNEVTIKGKKLSII